MAAKNPKGMTASSYRSVGKTHDGVTVLAPKVPATHFTPGQIRSTIKEVLREATTGQFVQQEPKISDKKASTGM